ncbi:ABC transporter substrate-binding protein [Calidifontibacillus oryziterrae]|uniref:ABC transporter substrate-binding protein n=1 Tax=Calidifontibacillus oryziterrae TaxID=1191699 RepID=UPI0002ECEF4F|nr:ABC transporter substrate-binding protein [Calidifontibacillus oryziterrae]
MRKLIIFLPLLAILLAVACGIPVIKNSDNNQTSIKSSTDLEQVQLFLAADGNAMYYAYIARDNGYFAEEGLDVELISGHGGTSIVQKIGSNTADFGIVAVPSLLSAWNEGHDIQAVYQINSTNLFDLIVPRYSDIRDISQLKGKVIGVTELGAAEVPFVQSLLANAGLNAEVDVTIRPFGEHATAKSILTGFENGEIAAFSGGAHDLVSLYVSGFKSNSLIPKVYKALPSTAIIANGSIINERPDLVEKIARAIARGTDFSIKNRNAALEIMKEAAPEEFTDEAVGQMCLDTFIDLSTPIETEKGYGYIYQDSWKKLIELFGKGDSPVITHEIDVSRYLNTSFVEKANQLEK